MNTVLLLIASNTFMTIAWYGHLKYPDRALWQMILISWVIALPEYILQVPANRFGYTQFTATQLKILQEVISLTVFVGFAWAYFGEVPNWRTAVAAVLIVAAVALIRGGGEKPHAAEPVVTPPAPIVEPDAQR